MEMVATTASNSTDAPSKFGPLAGLVLVLSLASIATLSLATSITGASKAPVDTLAAQAIDED